MQCLLTNEFLFFFLYMKPDLILSFFFSFFHLTIIENFSNSEYLGTKLSSIIIEKNLYYSSHFLHFLWIQAHLGMRGKRRTRDWPRNCGPWSRLSATPTSSCRKRPPSSTRWNGTRASCVAGVAMPRRRLTAHLPPFCHRRNRIRSIS